MATAPTLSEGAVNFEFQITRIKTEILSHFLELTDTLETRKNKLLKELEEIYNNYKHENAKHTEYISELEKSSKFIRENLQSLVLNDTQSGIIKSLEQKKKEIENELKSKHISFEFDDTLLDRIIGFGKISVVSYSCLPVVDYNYNGKVKPVVRVGTAGSRGSGERQFKNPWGVAVDYRTDNIYVADQSNNRVQVFNKDGKFLFQFGADKMNHPLCIAIGKERVFVSLPRAGCMLVFDLRGYLIKQIGTPGSGEGQFKSPRGVSINADNGDIYVCDYFNDRIQIFSLDYSYKSQFGIGIVKTPVDIQLTKDAIFVLSNQNPFLYSFNYNLAQVGNTLTEFISKHINNPFGFIIDGAGNFIISDNGTNCIYLFNQQGDLIHKLNKSISQPRGVTLDSKGRIIVAGYNNSVLIF